jgi:hypothetical protein
MVEKSTDQDYIAHMRLDDDGCPPPRPDYEAGASRTPRLKDVETAALGQAGVREALGIDALQVDLDHWADDGGRAV